MNIPQLSGQFQLTESALYQLMRVQFPLISFTLKYVCGQSHLVDPLEIILVGQLRLLDSGLNKIQLIDST